MNPFDPSSAPPHKKVEFMDVVKAPPGHHILVELLEVIDKHNMQDLPDVNYQSIIDTFSAIAFSRLWKTRDYSMQNRLMSLALHHKVTHALCATGDKHDI